MLNVLRTAAAHDSWAMRWCDPSAASLKLAEMSCGGVSASRLERYLHCVSGSFSEPSATTQLGISES